MRSRSHSTSIRDGFTLIEILMVLAIFGVLAAVTAPMFVRSMRGNRLRAGTRAIVSAGRYARSMALLKQVEMALVMEVGEGRITIRPAVVRKPHEDEEEAESLEAENVAYLAEMGSGVLGEESEPAQVTATGEAELVRKLDGVVIDYVNLGGDQFFTEGTCTILYRNNGRCDPYEVQITDRFGERVTIEVDALSSAQTTRD